MSWLVPRSDLTVAQSRAVQLGAEQHRLILGSPGSGKTIVLVHRARHLIDEYQIPPERFRLFVFTNSLKSYIRSALRDLALPDGSVMTFDAWCGQYYREIIAKRLPWNEDSKSRDWEAVREAVWNHARAPKSDSRAYDFVMVDEGQDLNCRDFETLRSVAAHVTVFMDHKQKIYESDANEMGVARVLGLRRRNLTLLDAYRCSPYIAQSGAAFIADPEERIQFIRQNPPREKGQRQLPLLYLAEDADDELAHLIEVIRTRVDRNERIGILLPQRRHVFGFAHALRRKRLDVEVNRARRRTDDAPPEIDFVTVLPKMMAFPSAKGLTFDTVLMPHLNRRHLKKIALARLERWLFVGITRATKWAYISSTDGDEIVFLDRFRELERRRQMTIMRGRDRSPNETDKSETDSAGEEPDLSDLF